VRCIKQRTITWTDPLENAQRLVGLTGLDAMRAIANGDVPAPPMAVLMDFRVTEVDEGKAVFSGQPAEFHYNPIGVVHGGLALTLLDSCMGCAVHTTLSTDEAYTTLEVKANLVRAITRDTGSLRAEGTVVHRGRRQATAEGRIVEEATGKLVAHGTTTCLVGVGLRPTTLD
jgi:uncharacterized protein (TIGR00369 family)